MRFRRPEPEPVEPPVVPGSLFEGDHCFMEGFYYPTTHDAEGNDRGPDMSKPLVYKGGQLLYAEPLDVSHFHAYGRNEVELTPGGDN